MQRKEKYLLIGSHLCLWCIVVGSLNIYFSLSTKIRHLHKTNNYNSESSMESHISIQIVTFIAFDNECN